MTKVIGKILIFVISIIAILGGIAGLVFHSLKYNFIDNAGFQAVFYLILILLIGIGTWGFFTVKKDMPAFIIIIPSCILVILGVILLVFIYGSDIKVPTDTLNPLRDYEGILIESKIIAYFSIVGGLLMIPSSIWNKKKKF